VPGILVNGNPKINFAYYSVDIISGGTPVTYRPDYLTGYYQFDDSEVPDDSALVILILKKYNTVSGHPDTIGIGSLKLATASVFTQFTVNVGYLSTETPDSVVIAFMSTSPDIMGTKGWLYVDNLMLSPSEGISPVNNPHAVEIGPNPVTDLLTVYLNQDKGSVFRIYNSTGLLVYELRLSPGKNEFSPDLPAGIYCYMVITDREGNRETGRLIISR
jgi:hypothetical protein